MSLFFRFVDLSFCRKYDSNIGYRRVKQYEEVSKKKYDLLSNFKNQVCPTKNINNALKKRMKNYLIWQKILKKNLLGNML